MVHAKPGTCIQLFTDIIELVHAKSGTHIHLFRDTIATGIPKTSSYSVIYVYNAAGPSTMKMKLIHCDINANTWNVLK